MSLLIAPRLLPSPQTGPVQFPAQHHSQSQAPAGAFHPNTRGPKSTKHLKHPRAGTPAASTVHDLIDHLLSLCLE